MKVHVFESAEAAGRAVAGRVRDALAIKPPLVLGLAAGHTPVPAYVALRRMVAAGEIDFARASTVNLDEFVGVERSHPGSFYRFMAAHLFDGIDIEPGHVHFLDGMAPNLVRECEQYEQTITALGGIDLQILGIGQNGHIAFNEPGDALIARTHVATLLPQTRAANAPLFGGDVTRVPAEALTMGVGTILEAREIVLIATGEMKAEAVLSMLQGPVTPRVPASFLQLHAGAAVYLDRAAASRL
ncbi:MAG TPA: glucosamine-6-phosphate deaminase [Vicinamibacterales bacterium]|nr:glucosamine-6-phosphate deaminase [Vicinamibacterales bacterium]